jgi:flavin-dependent dehydrogenase
MSADYSPSAASAAPTASSASRVPHFAAPDVDVIVVGGGPVGLAAAIEARMRSLSVVVVEPRTSAIDKACGEGLMPGAVPALARLGVDPQGFPLRGVSYRDATRRVDHLFASGEGRGVRRTTLHTALHERAAALGVEFADARVDSLTQDADTVTVAGIVGRYLLGADGLHSSVRRLVELERPAAGLVSGGLGPASRRVGPAAGRVGPAAGRVAPAARGFGFRQPDRRYGLRQHFEMEPESDLIEVYWTPTVEAYLTPVGDGVVGIAVLGPSGTDFATAVAAIPELERRIRGRSPASSLRGAGPFRQRTTGRVAGRVMLVGDASGYVDAITGEGIRVGLAQARAAIDCIAADAPQRYERAWSSSTRDFRMLTGGLVAAANSPLRGAIVPAAARLPRVFGAVVERLAR